MAPPGSKAFVTLSGSTVGEGLIRTAIDIAGAKATERSDGGAGEFPPMQGYLAVTADQVVFCKIKAWGAKPVEVVRSWPAEEINIEFIPKKAKERKPEDQKLSNLNPAVRLSFSDGSSLVAFGEPRFGITTFA